MLALIFLGSALLGYARANPSSSTLVLHEQVNAAPSGFQSQGSAAENTTLSLRIGLKSNNLSGLEDALYAVSTPGSARYGQYLSRDDVYSFVRPAAETTEAVTEWLASYQLTPSTLSPAGDWLQLSLTVGQANVLLGTDYHTFTHQTTGKQAVRTLSYSVPDSLKTHIDLIHPTVNFPIPSRLNVQKSTLPDRFDLDSPRTIGDLPESCQNVTTPACLQQLYDIPEDPAQSDTNSLFVSAFEYQFAPYDDIDLFLKLYRPNISTNGEPYTTLSLFGGMASQNQSQGGVEADLDVEYTTGIASGVPVTFVAVGPDNITSNNEFSQAVLDEATYLVGMDSPPHVLTTSYGVDETLISAPMANAICNAYMQLGARGTSIFYASGDGGVAGGHGDNCTGMPFIPAFPGTCPYVTAVGATQLIPGTSSESAANFTSGGFSNYFPAPAYQANATALYLKNLGDTNAGLFNASGRGFPDVSAMGMNFPIVVENITDIRVAGTSCSSPTFASIVALVNDRLIAAGKPTLGFLNPLLYSSEGSASLTDILEGNNPGCGTNGFNATTGWDPVTGLGTPNFSKFLTVAGL